MLPLKILAVDEDIEILELVENALAGDGHSVSKTSTLKQALLKLEEEMFDLFIIDIGLTDGNGLDLVRKIRGGFSGGIIVVSGRGHLADRVLGLELGADDYIVKPFHVHEMQARVRAVQRRLPLHSANFIRSNNAVHRFCGYEIDATKRSLNLIDGEEIHLTTKEFDVLLVLVENVNKVLKREEIVNAAFGKGHEMGGRPVDGLIGRLRGKLFKDGTGTLRIKTIRGLGYQLSC